MNKLYIVIKDSLLASFQDGDKIEVEWDEQEEPFLRSIRDPDDIVEFNHLIYHHVLFEVIKE